MRAFPLHRVLDMESYKPPTKEEMCVNSKILRDKLLSVALDASKAGSSALLSRFRPPMGTPLELHYKGPSDVVTDADIASDKAITDVLTRSGVPGDILSEESRTDKGDGQLTWLIDPLCGTLPFSTGLPHWVCVCVALRSGIDLLIGVVALPATGEVLRAYPNNPAALRAIRAQAK